MVSRQVITATGSDGRQAVIGQLSAENPPRSPAGAEKTIIGIGQAVIFMHGSQAPFVEGRSSQTIGMSSGRMICSRCPVMYRKGSMYFARTILTTGGKWNRSFLILSTFNDNHFLCGNVSDGCSVLSSGLTKRSIRWFLFPMTMAAAGGKQFCRLRRFILSHGRTRDRAGFSAAVNR